VVVDNRPRLLRLQLAAWGLGVITTSTAATAYDREVRFITVQAAAVQQVRTGTEVTATLQPPLLASALALRVNTRVQDGGRVVALVEVTLSIPAQMPLVVVVAAQLLAHQQCRQ
jgi:hypothetical protein